MELVQNKNVALYREQLYAQEKLNEMAIQFGNGYEYIAYQLLEK